MKIAAIGLCLLAVNGCYTFNDVSQNSDLGIYAGKRLVKDPEVLQYNIARLPGSIAFLEKNADATAEVGRQLFLKEGFVPEVKVIDKGEVYHSYVNKNFDTKGNYLIGSTNLSANERLEILLSDIAFSEVPDSQLDDAKIAAARKEPNPSGRRRVYIGMVKLSTLQEKRYHEIKGGGSVTGTGFGADGSAFSSDDNFSKKPYISVFAFDIDDPNVTIEGIKLQLQTLRNDMLGSKVRILGVPAPLADVDIASIRMAQ